MIDALDDILQSGREYDQENGYSLKRMSSVLLVPKDAEHTPSPGRNLE